MQADDVRVTVLRNNRWWETGRAWPRVTSVCPEPLGDASPRPMQTVQHKIKWPQAKREKEWLQFDIFQHCCQAPDRLAGPGSRIHKLVKEALNQHHITGKVWALTSDYYSSFSLRDFALSSTSEQHKLEKRIITGCTISVILLMFSLNMLVKSAEVLCRGPLTKSG